MLRPERRTRADVAAAAVLAVVVLVGGAVLWSTSDARGTQSRAATVGDTEASTGAAPAPRLPPSLAEVWRAPSGATRAPVSVDGVVVTGDGGDVTGRDPLSGDERWSYRRDRALCTIAPAFNQVLTVFRRDDDCNDVTLLTAATGARADQRTSPLADTTTLVGAPGSVAAVGGDYLEVWRSDLVRTLAYGALPSPVRPEAQPRPNCTHTSAAMTNGSVALVERCADDRDDRLTLQAADPEEADEPEVASSVLLAGRNASLVWYTEQRVAVALPNPPRLVVYDSMAKPLAEYPLDVPNADLESAPVVADVVSIPGRLFWSSGTATVSLDPTELAPRWTLPGTLGPSAQLAGRLLVPVPGALAVVDPQTGVAQAALPVDRGTARTARVAVGVVGSVVLEQRGDQLVALR